MVDPAAGDQRRRREALRRLRLIPEGAPPGLARGVALRLLSNVALRVPYTFLPELARTFDASLAATGAALGAAEASGLAGPAIGHVSDRWPRRRAMRAGALAFSVGAAVMAGAPTLLVLVLGGVVLQVGKLTADTALVAWVADHVPFERRGRVVAAVESTWPLALLLGAPLTGLLVTVTSIRAVYAASALALAVAAVVLVPDAEPAPAPAPGADGGVAGTGGTGAVRRAVPLLVAVGGLTFATQVVIVASGAWLEDVAGLSPGAVGVAVVALAAAELVGTTLTATLNDRIGKARCVVLGGSALVALVAGGGHVAVGFLALAVGIAGFEHALTSTFPLVAELAPERRATVMGTAFAVLTVCRSAGSVTGAAAYDAAGIDRSALLGLAAAVVAVAVAATKVRDPG